MGTCGSRQPALAISSTGRRRRWPSHLQPRPPGQGARGVSWSLRCGGLGVDAARPFAHKGAPVRPPCSHPRCSSTFVALLGGVGGAAPAGPGRGGGSGGAGGRRCGWCFCYGYWDWRFVPLLVGSDPRQLARRGSLPDHEARVLIPLAITANLLVLAVFKYFNFFADLAALVPGVPTPITTSRLPLGISFFTFHHIMYLTDLRAGNAPRYDLVRLRALHRLSSRRFSPARSCAGARSCTSSTSARTSAPDAAERFARGLMLLVAALPRRSFSATSSRTTSTRSSRPQPRARRLGGRGLAGDARLHVPDLFRLLRLHRHGARPRRCCSASCCRRTSTCRTGLPRCRISGGAGT